MSLGQATTSQSAEYDRVKSALQRLKESPIGVEGGNADNLMRPIYDYLMNIPAARTGALHWYCPLADPVTVDAATFLLRLFAFPSDLASKWKNQFMRSTNSCCECMKGYIAVRLTSRQTFFGAFSDEIIKNFWNAFDEWDVRHTKEILSKWTQSHPGLSLSEAPAELVYRIVANPAASLDRDLLNILQQNTPRAVFKQWPHEPPAPGLFYLVMSEHESLQKWAKSECTRTQTSPVPLDNLSQEHIFVIQHIMEIVSTLDGRRDASASMSGFPFARDPSILWAGCATLFRLLPPELLISGNAMKVDVRHAVTGHLHDTGPQFSDVFRCFLYCLKRLSARLWEGEEATYPQVVFDSIKDNPSFTNLVLAARDQGERPWSLGWFSEYLRTVSGLPIYEDVLAKITTFMCEELQHERFSDLRPIIMSSVARFLVASFRRAVSVASAPQVGAVREVFAIHANSIIAVAFPRALDVQWTTARAETRELLRCIMVGDIEEVNKRIDDLCSATLDPSVSLQPPNVRAETWTRVYRSLRPDDAEGVDMLLALVAKSAHVDVPIKDAFVKSQTEPDSREAIESVTLAAQSALLLFRDGFNDAISRFANRNSSSVILDLLQRPGVVRSVIMLMLSPIEEFQVAAKALVEQAFDVFSRADCFRALLENIPDASFKGILDSLDIFSQYAMRVPEACSLAKSLVRCLTEVIEVLCSSPDGLLHSPRFLKHANEEPDFISDTLSKLWHEMCRAIAVIFRRTQRWSEYFGNDVMIEWMRDALIFGRDLLAQRRVIESAVSPQSDQLARLATPRKLSSSGRKMIDDLQDVLLESIRWLRLTDNELLHQSFALLKTLLDCFRSTAIPPNEASLTKLRRHIESGRKQKEGAVALTRLDENRLLDLEMSLAAFQESDDDEVEIVGHTLPTEATKKQISHARPSPKKIVEVVITRQPSITGMGTSPKHRRPAAEAESKRFIMKQTDKRGSTTSKPVPTSNKFLGSRGLKVSTTFASSDKRRLDAETSMPKFQRPFKASGTASSGVPSTSKIMPRTTKSASSAASSSGASSSDSEEDGLKALTKLQQSTPKVKKPTERRQIKVMDLPTIKRYGKAEFAARQEERLSRQEQLRRTTLRLKPDVSPLHRILLSWDYNNPNPLPPHLAESHTRVPIPDVFEDYTHYLRILEPLLLMECWAQVLQSKEEPSPDVYTCTISGRMYVDDWTDIDIIITESVKKDWRLAETDVVLLESTQGKDCIMAKVAGSQNVRTGLSATLRCSLGTRPDPGLQINTLWRLRKIFSLTTLHREYAALMALPYYDCIRDILHPQLTPCPRLPPAEVERTMGLHGVNEPQAKAILASMDTQGFSLIQGPPGTGKTWTICGIVSTFLTRRGSAPTMINGGNGSSMKAPVKKILLCAPSNAAIDEVAKRLKDGVMGHAGKIIFPKVVRVGAEQAISANVADISLDQLVDKRLDASGHASKSATSTSLSTLRSELDEVRNIRQKKHEELSGVRDNAATVIKLEGEIQALNKRRAELSSQFDTLKDKQKSESRSMDARRRWCRTEILAEGDVICSTLSGAGHEMLEELDFEMVIIDEAAQAIELSSLIPLKYRCSRCIMVGDPQQLPPTVISQEASKYLYNQSLFVRLQKRRPEVVHLLSIQYRMHPDISQLPSKIFYQDRLKDGPGMAEKTQRPWHGRDFGPYRFFNVAKSNEQKGSGHSLVNREEVKVVAALYRRLNDQFRSVDFDFKVGIVSMYRAQVQEIRREFIRTFSRDIDKTVHFGTVDGFQGQEKDIIILSCVRAGPGVTNIGFLSDVRRMNVAITRARASLFIVGNAATLERSDATWRAIVQDAKSRTFFVDVDAASFSRPIISGSSVTADKSPIPAAKITPIVSNTSQPPPIPDGLVTPKTFKNTPKAITPSPVKTPKTPPKLATSYTSLETVNRTQKRSAAEVSSPRPAPALRGDPSGSRTQPPPPDPKVKKKKPKKPAQNLFIPKTGKVHSSDDPPTSRIADIILQRPFPPDDASSGPPTNKRRL